MTPFVIAAHQNYVYARDTRRIGYSQRYEKNKQRDTPNMEKYLRWKKFKKLRLETPSR